MTTLGKMDSWWAQHTFRAMKNPSKNGFALLKKRDKLCFWLLGRKRLPLGENLSIV